MYSVYFREAALRLYEYFHSMRKTAEALKISIASISRWTKEILPKKRNRSSLKVTEAIIAFIKLKVDNNPSITCSELSKEINNSFGFKISRQLIHLVLKRLNYSFKRIRKRGKSNKKLDLVKEFINNYEKLPKGTNIVAIDESGFDQRPLPIYGYAIKGQQAIMEYQASNNRKHYSLLMAISSEGHKQYNIFETSINGNVFVDFIANLEIPQNSIILLDNASIHKTYDLKAVVKTKKCQLLYTPPYSPEYNPIELTFGTIKNKFYKSRYFKNTDFKDTIIECVESIQSESIIKTFNYVNNLIYEKYKTI